MRAGEIAFGRFEIDADEARSGGMAAVYRARDRQTGELVALKVTHRLSAADRIRRRLHPAEVTHHAQRSQTPLT